MTIKALDPSILSPTPIKGIKSPIGTEQGQSSNGISFSNVLNDSISQLDSIQKEADGQVEGLTLGKEGFTPHSAMIALEKADTAFQLMTAVRSKIIRAYEEILRTQV
jgi:flagellar hook-basal body complex protein FliE